MLTASQALALMTPVEALCLTCIQSWLRVVQFKNGSCGEIDDHGVPWTRCSATEVQSWIAREFECEVSARQCQNALRSLEQSGRVIREKRWVNRWSQAYSYTVPSTDTPESIKQAACDQSNQPEEVDLSISSTGCSTKKSSVQSEVEVGRSDGPEPPAPSAKAKYISTGMSSQIRNVEGIPSGRGLRQIEEICKKIGEGSLPLPSEDFDGYVEGVKSQDRLGHSGSQGLQAG